MSAVGLRWLGPTRGAPFVLAAVAVVALAAGGRAGTGGRLLAPLDDAYIHLQYASSFGRGEPFAYHPHEPPSSGATSPAYALLLAPAAAAAPGTDGPFVFALLLGALSLGAAGAASGALAAHVAGDRRVAWAGALFPPAWGWAGWHAASGMETIPAAALAAGLAFALVSWAGRPRAARTWPWASCLVLLASLAPLVRPTLSTLSLLAALVLATLPPLGRPRARLLAAIPALAPLAGGLLWRTLTGRSLPNGAVAKWLPPMPWLTPEAKWRLVEDNAASLGRWLTGQGELERGYLPPWLVAGVLALAIVVPIAAAARRRRPHAVVLVLLVAALGAALLAQTTFATFRGHRFRYPMPFVIPLVAIGLGATARAIGAAGRLLRRRAAGGRGSGWAVGTCIGLALVPATSWPSAQGDYAEATGELAALHVPMAARLRSLPEDARVAVTDAGALAWFGGRVTVDLVGLTTGMLAADHYIAGPGAQLEWVDRIPVPSRPTHVVTFPRPNWWFPTVLFGRRLASFDLGHDPTIVGGRELALWAMRLEGLDGDELPLTLDATFRVLDHLDVADLGSERAHAHALLDVGDPRNDCTFRTHPGRAGHRLTEGGRIVRVGERFVLRGRAGRPLRIVLRTDGEAGAALRVVVNGVPVGSPRVPEGRGFREVAVDVPAPVVRSWNRVIASRPGAPVSSFHWWSATPR